MTCLPPAQGPLGECVPACCGCLSRLLTRGVCTRRQSRIGSRVLGCWAPCRFQTGATLLPSPTVGVAVHVAAFDSSGIPAVERQRRRRGLAGKARYVNDGPVFRGKLTACARVLNNWPVGTTTRRSCHSPCQPPFWPSR